MVLNRGQRSKKVCMRLDVGGDMTLRTTSRSFRYEGSVSRLPVLAKFKLVQTICGRFNFETILGSLSLLRPRYRGVSSKRAKYFPFSEPKIL